MSRAAFVLEVLEFVTERDGPNGWKRLGTKIRHIGYMNKVFRTKNEVCAYYDRHNPHMRGINAHRTFKSDWDPQTKLLYIVRQYHGVNLSIPPFCIQ